MSRLSLDGLSDLIDTIENIKNNNVLENSTRILLTKFDVRKSTTNDWVMKELERYKHLLFETKIRANEALNQAHMSQEPIFTWQPKSHGAEDYKQLTKELLSLCRQQKTN